MVLVNWLPYSMISLGFGQWRPWRRTRGSGGQRGGRSEDLPPWLPPWLPVAMGSSCGQAAPPRDRLLGILVTTLSSCLKGLWVVQFSTVASPRLPHLRLQLTSRLHVIPLLNPLLITPCECPVGFPPALTDIPPFYR